MQFYEECWRRLATLGAVSAVAALGACSGTTTPSAINDAQITQDVASTEGSAIAAVTHDFGNEDTEAGSADRVAPQQTALDVVTRGQTAPHYSVTGCTQGSLSGTWTFPPGDPRDTLTVSRTWSFFAAGVCQNAFDASTTDSIVFTAAVSAQLHGKRGFWQAHRNDQRTHWVTGSPTLRSAATHVWNGFGAGVDTSSFSGNGPESRAYTASAADTVTNVTFPHPRNGALYPSSGTFTRWVTAMATFTGPNTGSRQVQRHLVVTFNGTEFVPIVFYNVSNGQVAMTCQLDLAEGEIVDGSCK